DRLDHPATPRSIMRPNVTHAVGRTSALSRTQRPAGSVYARSRVSRRPLQLSVSRQQPADGASTYDGPGPFRMIRRTGVPIVRVPCIRCMRIQSGITDLETRRGTQRILLLRPGAGGELSGHPNSTAPTAPCSPTTNGILVFGPENPARIQVGSVPRRISGRHGSTRVAAAPEPPSPTVAPATTRAATARALGD